MSQSRRRISSTEFVKDFFAGMSDSEFVEKYRLSPSQLQYIFRSLLDAQIISPIDFESWQIFHNVSVPLKIRLYPRTILAVAPPIYEAAEPSNRGVILNTSEYGIGLQGLHAQVDTLVNLIIPLNGSPRVRPVTIQARCKWVAPFENHHTSVSGFYVAVVNETSWAAVRHAMAALRTGK